MVQKKIMYSSCGNREPCSAGPSILQETEEQVSSAGKGLGLWSRTGLEGDLKNDILLRDEEMNMGASWSQKSIKCSKDVIPSALDNNLYVATTIPLLQMRLTKPQNDYEISTKYARGHWSICVFLSRSSVICIQLLLFHHYASLWESLPTQESLFLATYTKRQE